MVKKIAIGILAYNEEQHIESVLNEILTLNRDVYVLNDSSTDRTMDILEELNTTKNFTIINNIKNEGAGNSTLKIIERAKNERVKEIILANSATVDGQTTAHYLADQLNDCNVLLSRLAQGLPIGGELDFLDDGTITQALKARSQI